VSGFSLDTSSIPLFYLGHANSALAIFSIFTHSESGGTCGNVRSQCVINTHGGGGGDASLSGNGKILTPVPELARIRTK